MATDPFRRVQLGDDFQPSATFHNETLEMLLERRGGHHARDNFGPDALAPGEIWIKNGSGSDVDAFDVLGLSNFLVLPSKNLVEAKYTYGFTGVTPTLAYLGKFAVLQEPIPDGKIGIAKISGLSAAQLDNPGTPPPTPYADIVASSKRLTGNWYGAAEILVTEVTGGKRWALVRLGNFQAPQYLGMVDEGSGITRAGGAGTVEIIIDGSVEDTVEAELWMDGGATAADDEECVVQFFRDPGEWRILNKECA